jgi:hypothetical protein
MRKFTFRRAFKSGDSIHPYRKANVIPIKPISTSAPARRASISRIGRQACCAKAQQDANNNQESVQINLVAKISSIKSIEVLYFRACAATEDESSNEFRITLISSSICDLRHFFAVSR